MYKVIAISDVHLGLKHARTKELIEFLKTHPTELLILNGDIIDEWAIRKNFGKNIALLRYLLTLNKSNHTRVVWTYGNHDETFEHLVDLTINNIEIKKDFIIDVFGRKYFVFHGHAIDIFATKKYKWISRMGAMAYEMLVSLNHLVNKLGFNTHFSKKIKERSKKTTNANFSRDAVDLAIKNNCTGVICGHVHIPKDEMIRGVRYLNSGDWVENQSAILIDKFGRVSIYNKK